LTHLLNAHTKHSADQACLERLFINAVMDYLKVYPSEYHLIISKIQFMINQSVMSKYLSQYSDLLPPYCDFWINKVCNHLAGLYNYNAVEPTTPSVDPEIAALTVTGLIKSGMTTMPHVTGQRPQLWVCSVLI
jgi:hypothetical protein